MVSRLTRFGSLWNYFLPLVPITVYIALMGLRVFPSFGAVSGIVYVAIGVTLWFLFAGFVQVPIQTLEGRFRELSRTEFPIMAAIVGNFGTLLFDTAIRLALVALIFVIFQGWPDWRVVFLPVLLGCAALFFFPLGLMLALLNLAYRDVNKVVRVALQYGLFLSGVLFPVEGLPVLGALEPFNPFHAFIESARTLAVSGTLTSWPSLVGFALAGLALGAVSLKAFYVLELRLRGLV